MLVSFPGVHEGVFRLRCPARLFAYAVLQPLATWSSMSRQSPDLGLKDLREVGDVDSSHRQWPPRGVGVESDVNGVSSTSSV
jgi:hypothetical protein